MIADVRRHLEARPFEPFTIVLSSGDRYPVLTQDHASVGPSGTRMVVWFDDEGSITLSALHVVGIEKPPASQRGAA